jgi:hypothetical protein
MSPASPWQETNALYLSTALTWLRSRLEQGIQRVEKPAPLIEAGPSPAPKTEPRSLWQRLLGESPTPKQPSVFLPRAILPPSDADAKASPTATDAAPPGTPGESAPALLVLAQLLGLSKFERELLLLCAATELDTGIASLCARAQGDPHRTYPTFALAMGILDEPSWDALSPEHPLRHWRLLEIHQAAGEPLTTSPLRADERIVNYVKGLNYLDDRLSPLLTVVDAPPGDAALPSSQQQNADRIVTQLRQQFGAKHLHLVQLLGSDAASKRLVAAQAATALGLRLYHAPAVSIPAQAAELENLARLWERDSILLPIALYIDIAGSELDPAQSGPASPLARLLARTGGVVFLDTRDVWQSVAQESLQVDVSKPTPAEQAASWTAALGGAAGESPELLAGQFNLPHSAIQEIARQALAEPPVNEGSLHDRLWAACVASTRPKLDALAQRLEPKVTWKDIVLPQAQRDLLSQIAAQVAQRSRVYQGWGFGEKMSRGLGIGVLFTGDAGVGKTMAAEVIAYHLKLNLYRIDLSAVVSKYIGETEKNLRRLFDAAEGGAAILFFDEADALFGKRSEVKDSHDRYANIEINYLLQRMEAYQGLAILATNMKSALDPAFMRRLRFVVNFPYPGAAERKAIWQKVFPGQTPTESLDFDRLARLNLTGGNIQSVALNAAFAAAHAGTPVTMPVLLEAARTELRKVGRMVNELEFRRAAGSGAVA